MACFTLKLRLLFESDRLPLSTGVCVCVKQSPLVCLNFDMNECNFSEKIMAIKDKNGMSREGSSRVAL